MSVETVSRTFVGSEVGVLRRVLLHRPDRELGRGRGGPRCMSCPIEREELS